MLKILPGTDALQPSMYALDLRRERWQHLQDKCLAGAAIGDLSISDIVGQGLSDVGLVLVRLPSDQVTDAMLNELHVAIGETLGQLMRQNREGSRLVKVRDTAPADTEATRGFLSNTAMKLHTDGWDAAALLCVQPAHSGGDSLFARSDAVYKRVAELRPDLASSLMDDWDWDVRVLCDDEERKPLTSPIFAKFQGHLFCRYGSYLLRNGAEAAGQTLSAQRLELLDLFDKITSQTDLQRRIRLERGDAIWINNRTMLHGRQAFDDAETEGRNLSRLWVRMPQLPQPDAHFLRFDEECFGLD